MWGNSPTFSRRPVTGCVEQPQSSLCEDGNQAHAWRASARVGDHHSKLAPGIARAMRKKSIVVAAGAALADGDLADAGCARVIGDEGAKIHARRTVDGPPRERGEDIRADLVAVA